MSRVDHWADVRDRSSFRTVAKPKPILVDVPPLPDIEAAQKLLAEKEAQLDALCAEIEALGSLAGPLSAQRIARSVAKAHNMSFKEMVSPRRHRSIVRARQQAMWEIRKHTKLSLPQIGRMLGDLDHTTVLHGIRQHGKRMGGELA